MRWSLRTLALPLVVSALAATGGSCTSIADAGSYHYDLGCDLTLRLTGFAVHTGSPLIVRVDSPGESQVSLSTQRRGVAILDKIPATPFTIDVPNGVLSEDSNLDFFADITAPFDEFNAQSSVGGGRGDHSWTIHRSCAEPLNVFAHNLQFSDFPITNGPGSDFQFETQNLLAANKNVEIRMIQYDPSLDAVDGAGTGQYTLVFYRRAADTTDDFTSRIIPAMLDRGVDSTVEVWVDRDDDQIVDDSTTAADPADEGYVFHIPADPLATGPIILDVSTVGTDDHSRAACVTVDP